MNVSTLFFSSLIRLVIKKSKDKSESKEGKKEGKREREIQF